MSAIISFIYNYYSRHPSIREVILFAAGGLSIAVAFVTVFSLTDVSTYPVGWERSYFVTPPNIAAKNPQVISRGSFIISVYEGKEAGKDGIYVSLSFTAGKDFLPPRKLAELNGNMDHNPHVAVGGNGHVAVVWQNLVGEGAHSRLFYAVSEDMGATWLPPVEVLRSPEQASLLEMEMIPRIFYDDRNALHVFFHGLKKESFNLYHTRSEDEKTFSSPQSLIDFSGGLRGAFFPEIRFDNQSIYLVWQGRSKTEDKFSDDLHFMKSENYGRSWSGSRMITRGIGNSASPSITVVNDTIYLGYQNNEEKTWAIYLKRGLYRGRDWDTETEKISDTQANCYAPVLLKSDNGELAFIWYDLRKQEPGIFVRKYSIPEKKLTDSVMLSKTGIPARNPAAVSSGKHIVVLWKEGTRIRANYSDIYAEPPVLFSKTHPENTWSRASSAMLEWNVPEDESGITGYIHVVNKDPNFIPPAVSEPTLRVGQKRFLIPNLDDGITYFHIRSMDGAGNFSRTVHYKIQVSKNPLVITDMKSPTHQFGKAAKSNAPLIEWSVNDVLRVKGFVYSLSRDKIEEPKTFTTDFSMKFANLNEGRYFFNVRPVDKTNSPGIMENYEIIVGKAEALDVDYLKRIAQQRDLERMPRDGHVRAMVPGVDVRLPFNPGVPYPKTGFRIVLSPRNIDPKQIVGYSVVVDPLKKTPPDTVTTRDGTIDVRNLGNGEYHLAVKAQYFTQKDGQKMYQWTRVERSDFTISVPVEVSPLVTYTQSIITRAGARWILISISMTAMAVSMITFGFGAKLSFYLKLVRYKIKTTVF